MALYNSSFLHQTTTEESEANVRKSCIILLFYIKPQRYIQAPSELRGCIILLFYIKPQLAMSDAYCIEVV